MRRVIAALDNTDRAGPVLAFARALAPVLGAGVDALHVQEDGCAHALSAAGDAGIPLHTVHGRPADCIRHEAESDEVVAVVIGRSTRPAEGAVGAVAGELLTMLPTPIAVVPADAVHPGRLGRVLVPLEGTRSTTLAPRRAVELAHDAGIDIVLLHVFDEVSLPAFTDQPQHETADWAREFLSRYSPCPPENVRLEIRVGNPDEHLLAVAREADADVIALGWSQELAGGRAPVVHAALEHAKLPVLLIPVVALEPEAAEQVHPLVTAAQPTTTFDDRRSHTIERSLD